MTAPDEHALRQAAEGGDISAITDLAHLLIEQAGDQETEKEQAAAAESYEWAVKAAEAGNLDAMYLTGMLLLGEGAMEEAQTWMHRAAQAGHPDAMDELGSLYFYFDEPEQAIHWYQKAADQGNASAAANLKALKSLTPNST